MERIVERVVDDPRFAAYDRRRKDCEGLIAILEEILVTKHGEVLLRLLSEADVPCSPVNNLALPSPMPK